jgi:hypothetical protein
MVGIDKTLVVIDELGELAVSAVKIAVGGVCVSSFLELGKLLDETLKLVKDIPQTIPEIADLDLEECGIIATHSFDILKKLLLISKAD